MKRFFRRYYVIEITPLKFHKFYHLILTPINIILAIYMIADIFLHPETMDLISTSYNIAILTCCVLTFIGCFKFRKYAWIAIMCGFALELIYDFCAVAFVAPLGSSYVWMALSQIAWRLVFIVLMIGYYIKRQPLFFYPVPYEELPKDLKKKA